MTLVTLRIRVDQGFLRRGQKGRITTRHCHTFCDYQQRIILSCFPTQEIGKIAAPTLMIAPLSLGPLSLQSCPLQRLHSGPWSWLFSLQIIEQLLLLCVQGPQGQMLCVKILITAFTYPCTDVPTHTYNQNHIGNCDSIVYKVSA